MERILPRRLVLALLVTAVLPAARPASAVPDFNPFAEFGGGATISVAWRDADGDGDADLAVGNFGNQQNYLYRNNGGTFEELPRFGARSTFAVVFGDCDNDGDPDLAVGNSGAQPNRLIVNNGDGTWNGQPGFGSWYTIGMAWADYDLDGDLDLALGNGLLSTAQDNVLCRNDGGNNFAEIAEFGGDKAASVAWGDFDSDGDPDRAVGNGGFGFEAQNYLYENNGDGTFSPRPEFGGLDTSCLTWGDADNDGDLDLAVANWNNGQNYLYRNDGGSFTALPRFGTNNPNTFAWGDFDNDGDLDLAVGNGTFTTADQNELYINEGGLVFTQSDQFGLGSTDGVAWADFDGDGDLDLAVGNEHTPVDNALYVNNENDADWLRIELTGRFHEMGAGYSNRDALGAKVAVYEAGFLGDPAHLLGYREIEAHGGFASQNDIQAHFGLPGRSSADVRITWPGSGGSNLVQDVAGVAVPGYAFIREGIAPAVSAPAPAAAGLGWRVAPNPMRDRAVLQYAGPLRKGVRFEVLDVTGRRVTVLSPAPAGEGARATWNGRNSDGLPAAPGVYFVRVTGGETVPPARITRVR